MVLTKEYEKSILNCFFERLKIWEMEEMEPPNPTRLLLKIHGRSLSYDLHRIVERGGQSTVRVINGALWITKHQEHAYSRWKDVTMWECSLSVQSFGEEIKTPLSSVEKELEFWGAIVGIRGSSRHVGLWAMPEDDKKLEDSLWSCWA